LLEARHHFNVVRMRKEIKYFRVDEVVAGVNE
jgi:hypothetical protein